MSLRILLAVLLVSGAVSAAGAQSGTRIATHTAVDFLGGELEGLGIGPDGELRPAPVSLSRWFTPALYIWRLAMDRQGRIIAGTGDAGGVVRLEGDTVVELARFENQLVMDLADGGDGILAATGPEGRVYRVRDGEEPVVVLQREEATAWSLARAADGERWLAGMGAEAVLVRFDPDSPDGGEVVADYGASVVRRLLRDGGRLWLATQGPSMIYASTGNADHPDRLRFDAGELEIPDMVADGEGGLWFLVLDPGDSEQLEPPSTRVMHLGPEGSAREVWSGEAALMSLALAADGGILVGEIGESRIHHIDADGRAGLWRDFGVGDASALLADGETTWVGTSNLGDLFRLSPPDAGRGVFTSPAVGTPAAEKWGRVWVEGAVRDCSLSVRSGMRSEPDGTWSQWSDWFAPGERFEVPLADYLQYRLRLGGGEVTAIRVSWARRNHPPVLDRILFGDGGGAEYDWTEQEESGYGYAAEGSGDTIVRPAALRALTRIRVEARDPDGDPLRVSFEVRREGEDRWTPLRIDGEGLSVEWDTAQFGDGLWRARVRATDDLARVSGSGAEIVSPPVRVDNSPPRLGRARREGDVLRLRVEDSGSRLRRVEVRVAPDGDYRRLEPMDGVLDGETEEFELADPGRTIWVRARDAAGNESIFIPRLED